jgi:ABC-type nickel/cobalt efflux system permease component RcnA
MRCALSRVALGVGVLLALLAMATAEAQAQAETKPPSAFGGATQQSAPPAFTSPQAAPPAFTPRAATPKAEGPFGRLLTWVAEKQRGFQRELAESVKRLKDGNAIGAALLLAGFSFLYGVFHAVGPGHGKAIITSFVVSNEATVRRGVLVSFLAAGFQALTAVALVSVLLLALNATGMEVTAWANTLESASYALIAAVGLYLLATQLARLWQRWQGAPVSSFIAAPAGHIHDHGHHEHAHDHHQHAHGQHEHVHEEHCGHIVDARELAGRFSWGKMLAVALSVGIRPCTGAILVLVFALAQGLFWAGVAATFAMALGTAITVAVLATLALGSRELVLKLGGGNAAWTETVWSLCAIGGALIIFLFGATLFLASLGPARPF